MNIVNGCGKRWCALIALDVRNAFNTADWSLIIKCLYDKGVSKYLINTVSNYLRDRKLQLTNKETMDVSMGVPQGSVLGPVLWNILYDGVFGIGLLGDSVLIGYADDLALIVSADSEYTLMTHVNENLELITKWMERNNLVIAPEKTEAIVLRGKRDRRVVQFRVGNIIIYPQKCIRYLGVILDCRLAFGEHIKRAVIKAEERVAMLSRIMPNIGGPSNGKRKVLCEVVHSIVLYAAPVWHVALQKKCYLNMLERVQRKMLLRVASSFRTVSAPALQVLTGVLPIDLLVEERKTLYEQGEKISRKEARKRSMDTWQQRWDTNQEKAQWTKELIRDINSWIACKHKRLDYFITQVLTGHGVFRSYAKRMNKDAEDRCMYCGETDTVRHTVFICGRWDGVRSGTIVKVGGILSPENVIDLLTASNENWNLIHDMFKRIMKAKEREERLRQAGRMAQPD